MPAFGTRRSTTVFVPKALAKATADVAGVPPIRSLCSGTRYTDSEPLGKNQDGGADEWLRVLGGTGGEDELRWWGGVDEGGNLTAAEPILIESNDATEHQVLESHRHETHRDSADRRLFGIVFRRKRRRPEDSREDRKYGIVFTRKRRKKLKVVALAERISRRVEIVGGTHENVSTGRERKGWELRVEDSGKSFAERVGLSEGDLWLGLDSAVVLAILVDTGCRSTSSWVVGFLVSILRWMRSTRVRLQEFVIFVLSGPLASVLSVNGLHLFPLQYQRKPVLSSKGNACCGVCWLYGAVDFVPLISLDFSALPIYFKSLHMRMTLGSLYLPGLLARSPMRLDNNVPTVVGFLDYDSRLPSQEGFSASDSVSKAPPAKGDKQPCILKSLQTFGRNAIRVNGFRLSKHKKKRSSLRQSRIRNAYPSDLRDTALISGQNSFCSKTLEASPDSFCARDHHGSPPSVGSKRKQRKTSSIEQFTDKSQQALAEVKQNIGSIHCNVNILVNISDRCWREEGAQVMLEPSSSNEWCLAVKCQGSLRFLHKPQELRSFVVNRFTHAYIWTVGEGWKLEFSDRWNWLAFKELHMECRKRNAQGPLKVIPVPGVREVSDYEDQMTTSFSRPDMYTVMRNDEVERARASNIAYYDMDSEDEDWLKQLNSRFLNVENGAFDHLSDENFEKMIFSLEKEEVEHGIPNIDKAVNICEDLANKDVVAEVFDYWLNKRNCKGKVLVRVFQAKLAERAKLAEKAQLPQQSVHRKKKSPKRQRSLDGRDKTSSSLNEVEILEAQGHVQAAEGAARKAEEHAISLRSRAQLLMANAELAVYKSVMALRIAEIVGGVSESPDFAASILE